jgi:hypothetical protein
LKLFITAGIGQKHILDAAERLKAQVAELNIFDSLIIVTEKDLLAISPWIFDWYSERQLKETPGYGHYAWKSAIASAAANGYWGKVDVVMYLDAGCEVLPGSRSRRIIKKWIRKAQEFGVVGFSTFTPEWQYTKSELIEILSPPEEHLWSDQFQSGTWLLGGDVGRLIAKEWNQICKSSPNITDEISSDSASGFVAHRHDQSVFSILLKKYGVTPERIPTPYPNDRFRSFVTGMRSPIWASRNRTGITRIPLYVRILVRLLP